MIRFIISGQPLPAAASDCSLFVQPNPASTPAKACTPLAHRTATLYPCCARRVRACAVNHAPIDFGAQIERRRRLLSFKSSARQAASHSTGSKMKTSPSGAWSTHLPSSHGAHLNAKPRLLVVDDDRDLCSLVARYLEPEGFSVSAAHTGAEGIENAAEGNFELIVLDVMLPDRKGFDVLRELRNRLRTPVLMLTARGDEFDRVLGLELGADDYLPKPFSPRELVARISAILRRSGWQAETDHAGRPAVVRSADLELDPAARTVHKAGKPLKLTSAEFGLLQAFFNAPGQVLTRESLVERVLDRKFSPFDRSIDLHISNLRRKLGPQQDGSERIRSVRGIGYLYAWPTRASTESCKH